jgi:hypothetical protein
MPIDRLGAPEVADYSLEGGQEVPPKELGEMREMMERYVETNIER